jgi:hypothetical protein
MLIAIAGAILGFIIRKPKTEKNEATEVNVIVES